MPHPANRPSRNTSAQPLESLEPRLLFTAVPLITEFLASNDTVLDDEDGDSSDWIEIYNAGDTALDLDGWHLTDRADDLTQWTFPSVSLDPGEYLVVFASNKDRADADGTELHTNFALSAGGEYLALVEADGTTVADEYAPEYPAQSTDVSYGIAQQVTQTTLIDEGDNARFTVPTGPVAGWNTLGFNDSGWTLGPTGIGYETSPADFSTHIESTVPSTTPSLYMRQTFNIADTADISQLELRLRYDDGFLAYLNGVLVASANDPAGVTYNSNSTVEHPDPQAVEFVSFNLSQHIDELVAGNNVLAIQALNQPSSSDMLIEPKLIASTIGGTSTLGYMITPTPGALNIITGPIIESVTQNPPQPGANQNLVIEASVAANANPLDRVDLHYRVNYAGETAVQIFDNGLGSDAVAGDGVFTGVISSGLYAAGDMVRWYVTAEDTGGTVSRAPVFLDTDGEDQDPEYFGTVVADPATTSDLPIFQWFVQNPNAAEGTGGTRASVFFNGRFYDNVFVRQRGASSQATSKKSFKFEFNKGDNFIWAEGERAVDEINLNTTITDKAYIRQPLAFEIYDLLGAPGSESQLWRVEQNGGFFSVAAFVEQPDEDLLIHEGLDPNGALYKSFNSFTSANGYDKKTRDFEGNADLADLISNVNGLSGTALHNYLFDNIDLPATLNYLVATVLTHQNDNPHKNHYMYRDTEGTGEWLFLPWDHDLAIGSNWVGTSFSDTIYADNDSVSGRPGTVAPSHPFVNTEQFREWNQNWNRLMDALLTDSLIQEMFLRRLRSGMDLVLGDPNGNVAQSWFNQRVIEMRDLAADDVALDYAEWADPWTWGSNQSFNDAINVILNDYATRRRQHLYVNHSINNPGYPDNAGIPDAQIANPSLTIGNVEFNPAGGDQDQEYIQLINNNAFALDLTGWTVEGAITHSFAPGTVIGAGQTLYITPSSSAFRARTTGPTGGQGHFVQQWDSGHLSSFSETITIKRANGTTAATKTYVGDPSPEQEHLRIVELHYNPTGPTASEQLAGFTDGDQFEFIELINTSATETIDLAGVSIDNGLSDASFTGANTNIFSATFTTGVAGFTYEDNTFNGTTETGVGSGTHDATGGNDGGGAIRVDLATGASGNANDASSGAYTRLITLASDGPVTIDFDFRFLYGGGFESNEIGQAIAEFAGVRLGSALNGSLVSLTGDGNNGPPTDTGWQPFSITLDLTAGTHLLSLGAYYSQSTFENEAVTAWFDNLAVTAAGPVPLAPGQRALLVADLAAFTERYGQQVVDSVDAIAEYTGNLANGGESLKLNDANGSTILDFRYEDGTGAGEADWPTTPDGDGPSLVVNDTEADYSDGNNWRAHHSTTTAPPEVANRQGLSATSPATASSARPTSTPSSRSGATPQHQAPKPPTPTWTTPAPSAPATSTSSSTTSATAQHPPTRRATVTWQTTRKVTTTTPPATTAVRETTAMQVITTTAQATTPPSPASARAPTSPPPNADPPTQPQRQPQPPRRPHARQMQTWPPR
ncbi:lamin tail domain-containing protein [Phycisphaeraceae bacterium D3-23]